jgi:hypothetical protein
MVIGSTRCSSKLAAAKECVLQAKTASVLQGKTCMESVNDYMECPTSADEKYRYYEAEFKSAAEEE